MGKDAAANYTTALSIVSSQLEPVRTQAEKLAIEDVAGQCRGRPRLFHDYSVIIDQFLDADQAAALQIDDARLRNGAELLNTITRQSDIESRLLIETALTSFAHDPAGVRTVQQLAGLQDHFEKQLTLRRARHLRQHNRRRVAQPGAQGRDAAMQAAANDPMHVNIGRLFDRVPDSTRISHVLSNVAGVVQEPRRRSFPPTRRPARCNTSPSPSGHC